MRFRDVGERIDAIDHRRELALDGKRLDGFDVFPRNGGKWKEHALSFFHQAEDSEPHVLASRTQFRAHVHAIGFHDAPKITEASFSDRIIHHVVASAETHHVGGGVIDDLIRPQ